MPAPPKTKNALRTENWKKAAEKKPWRPPTKASTRPQKAVPPAVNNPLEVLEVALVDVEDVFRCEIDREVDVKLQAAVKSKTPLRPKIASRVCFLREKKSI